ncbi:MAG: SUMF1/EgtB/PvdO family nonheme iron enzyme [Labilithrix sp.]|nr:SUMF1/EgtB/PvdO family nonheme iron enzyme [Labilithrix sp.]MBX3223029.1 SUMF1/EgtB/PvdO family nonheme iron enzyme [Labilithrix sp.]
MERELGAGAVGVVLAALDRETRRSVALKLPLADVDRDEIQAEARVTAQLEHPAIVPVYDVGHADDGRPYYTMRIVGRHSLRDILRAEGREGWSLARLVSLLVQIARALGYAHERGVVHRDLKPGNVLVGDHGEVYVADWGLARVDPASPVARRRSADDPVSGVIGTPGYLAPETLGGPVEAIDQRVDLFSLGVILYEVLTGAHPFRRATTETTLAATRAEVPPRPRAVNAECPLLLDDLCVELLAKDPSERPVSAYDVARRLEDFLEGARERERREAEAHALAVRARAVEERWVALDETRAELERQARERLERVRGWEPASAKREAWLLEDRAGEAARAQGALRAEAIELYSRALVFDPSSTAARRGLADIYFAQARLAEDARHVAEQAQYEALVLEHDDGRYAARLGGDARLSLASSPSGARVRAWRYVERDRILVPEDVTDLGTTPVRDARLAAGSWLLTLERDGHRDVRYPVLLRRGERHEGSVRLYDDAEIGDDFVYVPGGAAILGGDAEAYDPYPRREALVGDFAIARYPVTMREYCTFLDALTEADPERAARHVPRGMGRSSSERAVTRVSGRWQPDDAVLDEEARARFPLEDGHAWRVPVTLVDGYDAEAFAAWSGARLVTDVEWEKAARGVDGRFHPWGDRFDPTFCHMRESRRFASHAEPAGSFAHDESPYGVRDMAGGVREWVADVVLEPLDAGPAGELLRKRTRSGDTSSDRHACRAASRSSAPAILRAPGLGFRLARSLGPPASAGELGPPGAAGERRPRVR